MRFTRLFRFVPVAAIVGLAAGVFAAQASQVSLLTGPLDPSGTLGTLNGLINTMNTAYGSSGPGNTGDAIFVPTVSSIVNKFSMTPGATNVTPILSVGGSGSDTNIGIVVSGKGSGAFHAGGSTAANASLRVPTVASAVNQVEVGGAVVTTGIPYITVGGASADTNAAISLSGKGTGASLVGGTTTTLAGLQVAQPASRVNGILVTPGATGTFASITSATAGADATAGLFIAGNSTGPVYIGGTTTTLAGLQVAQTASRVNGIVVTPGATGTAPTIAVGGAGADATRNLSLLGNGSSAIVTLGPAIATCSGTTTATCQGQRFIASITGLTTAAVGVESAAMTVTNASVVSAASIVQCNVNIYAGTGIPIATRITPGTGTVSFTITNVAGSGSLNATVPVACVVF